MSYLSLSISPACPTQSSDPAVSIYSGEKRTLVSAVQSVWCCALTSRRVRLDTRCSNSYGVTMSDILPTYPWS